VRAQEIQSPLLSVEDAAVYGQFKLGTLRDWILKKKIAYVKRGRRVFIRRKDLDALIDRCLVHEVGAVAGESSREARK